MDVQASTALEATLSAELIPLLQDGLTVEAFLALSNDDALALITTRVSEIDALVASGVPAEAAHAMTQTERAAHMPQPVDLAPAPAADPASIDPLAALAGMAAPDPAPAVDAAPAQASDAPAPVADAPAPVVDAPAAPQDAPPATEIAPDQVAVDAATAPDAAPAPAAQDDSAPASDAPPPAPDAQPAPVDQAAPDSAPQDAAQDAPQAAPTQADTATVITAATDATADASAGAATAVPAADPVVDQVVAPAAAATDPVAEAPAVAVAAAPVVGAVAPEGDDDHRPTRQQLLAGVGASLSMANLIITELDIEVRLSSQEPDQQAHATLSRIQTTFAEFRNGMNSMKADLPDDFRLEIFGE